MNKNAIQKFAIWARKELITQVSQRAYQYGIDESGFGDASADTLNGRLLTAEEKSQRQELIGRIKEKSYKQVMEEVAYTWFNRFIALRFMEVNNYLPSHIRVFSDASGAFKPEILSDVLHLELPGLSREKVAEYIESNDTEGLYRYLLLTQCNALNDPLPRMFEEMGGYTELLLPNNILKQDSVLGHMVADIPEEDWQNAVQIIGWLYQYYNTELKDDTFALLKKNVKITKERIPSATQLFTPDWIVRYMVENSLGRLWLEGHPNAELHDGWKYYLDEAEQEPEVEAQLAKLREEYTTIKPEEIKVIDPCMGSGHILVYAFDVLMQIYTSAGWDQREAAQSILENNLYGLDIDDRAAQLAYFAVMMKARQYDRRLLTRGIQPHIYAFAESNTITTAPLHDMGITLSQDEYDTAVKQVLRLLDELRDAKEYGSILTVTPCDWDLLRRFAVPRTEDEGGQQLLGIHGEQIAAPLLQRLINIGEALSQQYDVVVTNPPYMAVSNAGAKVNDYVKKNFPDSKADMFAVFIERCGQMTKKNGYQAMITQHAWMFLSSFERMRERLLRSVDIVTLAHLGVGTFVDLNSKVVQSVCFVFQNNHAAGYIGRYDRLFEQQGIYENNQEKEKWLISGKHKFLTKQEGFFKIPGSPVAYWASAGFVANYSKSKLGNYSDVITGMTIGDNNKYLRLWHEVNNKKVSFCASRMEEVDLSETNWIPYSKGGPRRNWYGNYEYVVNWAQKDHFNRSKTTLKHLYLKSGITWPFITSGDFSARFLPRGFLWDVAGSPCFFKDEITLKYALAALCSKSINYILKVVNPTINVQAIDIAQLPFTVDAHLAPLVVNNTERNISISAEDWDSYETSWDFKRNPLV